MFPGNEAKIAILLQLPSILGAGALQVPSKWISFLHAFEASSEAEMFRQKWEIGSLKRRSMLGGLKPEKQPQATTVTKSLLSRAECQQKCTNLESE